MGDEVKAAASKVVRFASRLLLRPAPLVGLVLVVNAWFFVQAEAADAYGLDFTCSASDGGGAPVDVRPSGLRDARITFRGISADPDATPLEADFNPSLNAWRLIQVEPGGNPEFSFKFSPALSTQTGEDMGLRAVFADHFRLRPDLLNLDTLRMTEFGGAGLVLTVATAPEWAAGRRYHAEFGVALDFVLENGEVATTNVRIGLDTRGDGAAFPRQFDIGLLMKNRGGDVGTNYFAVGMKPTLQAGQVPAGLGVTVRVDEVTEADLTPMTDIALDWDTLPERVGLGLSQRCHPWDPQFESTAQIGWELTAPVPPAVDLAVRHGVGSGRSGADELHLAGRVSDMPRSLDWVMHPDRLDIVHAPESQPDLNLTRLAVSTEPDPEAAVQEDDLYATGRIEDLPPHLRVEAERGPGDSFDAADIRFCPNLPAEDRPVLNGENGADLPEVRPGCMDQPRPEAVDVTFQNWLPEDGPAVEATAELPEVPEGDGAPRPPHILWASRSAALAALPGPLRPDLYRFSASVSGAERIAYDTRSDDPDATRFVADLVADRDQPASRILYFDADGVTTDGITSPDDRLSFDAVADPLPATTHIEIRSSENEPVFADVNASSSVVVTGTVDATVDDRRSVKGAFELGARGAATRDLTFRLTKQIDAGRVAYAAGYEAIASTRVRAGVELRDLRARDGKALRVRADALVAAGTTSARWRSANGSVTDAEISSCPAPNPAAAGCAVDADVVVLDGRLAAPEQLGDLLTVPQLPEGFDRPPADRHVLYALQDPRPADGLDLETLRIAVKLPRVSQISYRDNPLGVSSTEIAATSRGIPDAQVRIRLDRRDRVDEVSNRGTLTQVEGTVRPWPDSLRFSTLTQATTTRVSYAAGARLAFDGTAQIRFPGPVARAVDADVEIGVNGAGLACTGLVQIQSSETSRGNPVRPGTLTTVKYSADAASDVRVGAVTTTRADRASGFLVPRDWIHVAGQVPRTLTAQVFQDKAGGRVSWADVTTCTSVLGCPANVDVVVVSDAVGAWNRAGSPALPPELTRPPARPDAHLRFLRTDRASAESGFGIPTRVSLVSPALYRTTYEVTGRGTETTTVTARSGNIPFFDVEYLGDGRTSEDEVQNRGTYVQAAATIEGLPSTISVRYTGDEAMFRAGYEASAGLRVQGTARVDGAGPDVDRIDAAFRIGYPVPGSGLSVAPLPKKASVEWRRENAATETVSYHADTQTHVLAGALFTDRSDRSRGFGTRVWAKAILPQTMWAAWYRDRDGDLSRVDVAGCDAAQRAGCANDLDLAVVRGRVTVGVDLLTRPELPGMNGQPVFRPRMDADGLAVVHHGKDDWGVSARRRNIVDLRWERSTYWLGSDERRPGPPQDFCMRTRRGGRPFVVGLLDDSAATVVWADATISLGTDDVGGMLDPEAGGGQPWLWLNTESCDISLPPDVSPDADGGAGSIEGTVRVGDAQSLATIPLAFRPIPGFFVTARVNTPAGTSAVQAALRTVLPRHLKVYEPVADERCLQACDQVPYEPDEHQYYRIEFESTLQRLGPASVSLDLDDGTSVKHLGVYVDDLPGSLDASLALTENRRLPWTDADFDLDAAADVGELHLTYEDLGDPRTKGGTEAERALAANRVPMYDLTVRNIPRRLDLDVRLHDGEAPDAPLTRSQRCSGTTLAPSPQLEYLHASVDLRGEASEVSIRTGGGSFETGGVATYEGFMSAVVDANAPIDVSVQARLNNVAQKMRVRDSALVFFTSDLDACLDFDLPLDLRATDVSSLRLAQNGSRLRIDVPEAEIDAGADVDIYAREWVAQPGGGPAWRNGAYYEIRDVHYDPVGIGDYEEDSEGWQPIYFLTNKKACQAAWGQDHHMCYANAAHDHIAFEDFVDDTDGRYSVAKIVIDPLFDEARHDMWDDDDDGGWAKGGGLYDALRDGFTFPDSVVFEDAAGPAPGYDVSNGSVDIVMPACDTDPWMPMGQSEHILAESQGSDGTRHRLVATDMCRYDGSQEHHTTTLLLVALFPTGEVRWVKPLRAAPLVYANKVGVEHRFEGALLPDKLTGAVTVDLFLMKDRVFFGSDIVAHERAIADASGYGAGLAPPPDPLALPRLDAQTGVEAALAARPQPVGTQRLWILGDGTVVEGAAPPRHTYVVPGVLLGMTVDSDDGELMQVDHLPVTVH
ncbi:MAG: hypothetical protein IT198_14285 [Acidimicrobiia bacterium]|nr:hypothetical protein [Acidimicrobiia bacterium]